MQFKFDKDTQVGVSYYHAGLVASFGEEIANALVKQGRGKIIGKAPQRKIATAEDKMVTTETKPTEGARNKFTK